MGDVISLQSRTCAEVEVQRVQDADSTELVFTGRPGPVDDAVLAQFVLYPAFLYATSTHRRRKLPFGRIEVAVIRWNAPANPHLALPARTGGPWEIADTPP